MVTLNLCSRLLTITGIVFLAGCYYYPTPVSQYPDYYGYYPQPVQPTSEVNKTTQQQQNYSHNHVNKTTNNTRSTNVVNNTYNNAGQYDPYHYTPYGYNPYYYQSPQVATNNYPQQKPKNPLPRASRVGVSRAVQAKSAIADAKPVKSRDHRPTVSQSVGKPSPKPSSPTQSSAAVVVEKPVVEKPRIAVEKPVVERPIVKRPRVMVEKPTSPAKTMPSESPFPKAAKASPVAVPAPAAPPSMGYGTSAPTTAQTAASPSAVVADAKPVPSPAAASGASAAASSAISIVASINDLRPVYNALHSGDQAAFEAAARQVAASLKSRGYKKSQLETPFPPAAFEGLGATPSEEAKIIAEISKHL